MVRLIARLAVVVGILAVVSIVSVMLWRTHCADQASSGVGFLNLCFAGGMIFLRGIVAFLVRILVDPVWYLLYRVGCFVWGVEAKSYRQAFKPSARFSAWMKRRMAKVHGRVLPAMN